MGKKYTVVAIDDQPENMNRTFKALTTYVKAKHNYSIECIVYSNQEDFDSIACEAVDIVMFDMALTSSNFTISGEATELGYKLIQKFRETNKRTKIIFYSGGFNLDDSDSFALTPLDFVRIINELNIFAILPRDNIDLMGDTIARAIESVDSVLISLEDLIIKYGEDGMFRIDGKEYSAQDLLIALRIGSPIGEKFRKQVTETIVAYFMRFGD